MTHQHKRCDHCAVAYSYQGSGYGCFHPENDPRFCPTCMRVINEALRAIPVKKKQVWLPLQIDPKNPVTVELFEKLLAEKKVKQEANPFFIKSYTLTGYSNIKEEGVIDYQGVRYRLMHNTDTGEKLVEARLEEDIVDGTITGAW